MKFCIGFIALCLANATAAKTPRVPDCSGPNRYPASEAYVYLKNEGILAPERVDFKRVKSAMIASQHIRTNLWRQVFRVTFPLKAGGKVEAIVVNDTSIEECSMSTPQIFLVARQLL